VVVSNPPRLAVFAFSFAILCFAGCGDEDSGGDGGDGGGLYDDPSDFDRGSCGGGEPLDSVDPTGIWHVDTSFGGGSGAGAMRIDQDGGAGFSALVFGGETSDVRLSSDDLFIRREAAVDGGEDVVAIDLCQVGEDGGLSGLIASCARDDCIVGQIRAFQIQPLDEPESENMTLVAEWAGSEDDPWDRDVTVNVRHHGTLAYAARWSDGLRIVDLADPARPVARGHLAAAFPDDGEYYNDIKVTEAADGKLYAFLASNLRGVVAIDVSDPDAPVEVSTFPPPPAGGGEVAVHTLFTEGDRLYAANTSMGGLEIFDIADPATPSRVGEFVHPDVGTLGGFVHDLFVQDRIAYLNYWNLGMVVVDTADPEQPVEVGVFDDYQRRTSHSNWVAEVGDRRVAVHGDEDFDAHVRIVDVDPASETAFTEIGSYQTRAPVSVHNIMAVGELALVTYYQDGLRVLDLADPTSPVEIAHFATWPGNQPGYGSSFYEGAIGVDYDAERDLILVADTHRGLLVLQLDE
jgi:hypothetical protein